MKCADDRLATADPLLLLHGTDGHAKRKAGRDSLSGLVRNTLMRDPLTGDVKAGCVFVSRMRMHIKLLYWDGDGFVLYYKRLEKGRFDLPVNDTDVRELRRDAARFSDAPGRSAIGADDTQDEVSASAIVQCLHDTQIINKHREKDHVKFAL